MLLFFLVYLFLYSHTILNHRYFYSVRTSLFPINQKGRYTDTAKFDASLASAFATMKSVGAVLVIFLVVFTQQISGHLLFNFSKLLA